MEKVQRHSGFSKESLESQMFSKITTGEDFYFVFRDLTYVIANSSIRTYFEGKSAPVLPTGQVLVAERLGEELPKEAATADKAKGKTKAPAKKTTKRKTTTKQK
jgi:hypothetical protein